LENQNLKPFDHELLELPELSAEIVEGVGRVYTTPDGNKYPSVTTVLGAASDNSWLEEWKARVGEEEVRKVSAQASRRGTAVHELAEEYLKNNPRYTKGHMPANIATFNQIRPVLDKHVTTIYGLEVPLYSDKLRVAGRVDCLALWENELSIIDFKTSKRVKQRKDISNYFIQASAYAYMIFERTGLLPKQVVIMMMVDDSEPLVFVEKTRDWIEQFIELRKGINL
jgi:genome maintenance exonuclease 1